MSRPRESFTGDDDALLVKYIATYAPTKAGRMGNNLYKRLVENNSNKWPWSRRHPWQSWRERYKKEETWFNAQIRKYQKQHGIEVPEKNEPTEVVHPLTKVKAQDVVKNERHETNEAPTAKPKLGPANAARKTVQTIDHEVVEERVEMGQKRKAVTGAEREEGEAKKRRVEGNGELSKQVVGEGSSADARTTGTAETNQRNGTSNSVPEVQSPQASVRSDEHVAVDSQAGHESPGGNLTGLQEVAIQATASPSQNQEYLNVDDKLISALRNLGRSIGRRHLVKAIRWNGLGADIEARILADTQQQDGIESNSEDYEETDTISSRAISPESTFDHDTVVPGSHEGSGSGAVRNPHSADEKRFNETVVKAAAKKVTLRNMGNKKKRVNDEDIFASDPGSPDSVHEASRIARPEGSTSTTLASQAGLSKTGQPRALPQMTNGPFKTQYTRAKGVPSYRRIPDMSSDSESDSAVPAASSAAWPPLRQKKLLHLDATDKPLSKRKDDEVKTTPNPFSGIRPAHKIREAVGAQAGPAGTHQLAHHAESDADVRTANAASESVAPEPGPSRPPPPREEESQAIANDIQAWREKTNVLVKESNVNSPMPSVSPASAKPFAASEHEGPMSHSTTKGRMTTRTDANRRQTFGGFTGAQALPFKEVDLRRTIGRRSIASGLPGLSQDIPPRTSLTPDSVKGSKLKHSRRSSMASSVASTIELLTDSDIPDVPILPDDGEMAMRIGFSHIFKAMADNHGVPEQWLRDTYKLLGSIRKTDEFGRAAAIAAEQVGNGEPTGDEDELEADNEEGEDAGTLQDPPAPIKTTVTKETPLRNEELRLRRSSGRKAELEIMPADEDSLPRIRETYSPPRPSRAAKYARLKREGREEEAKERERRRASSHSPSKRLETEPSHSSPLRPTSVYSDSGRMGGFPVSPVADNTLAKTISVFDGEPWTAEEDEIIRRGNDIHALREIEERRGKGSVCQRTNELTGEDLF